MLGNLCNYSAERSSPRADRGLGRLLHSVRARCELGEPLGVDLGEVPHVELGRVQELVEEDARDAPGEEGRRGVDGDGLA